MYKITAVAFSTLLLVGCQSSTGTSDWTEADGCSKYFSETPRDLAACKAYVQSKKEKQEYAASGAVAVTQAAEGTKVDQNQGLKVNETSEDNQPKF